MTSVLPITLPKLGATPPTASPERDASKGVQSVALSAADEQKWEDTMRMMAWTAPGFRHIFYNMLSKTHNAGGSKYTGVMTRDVPFAATDGQNLLLNPDTFFEFGLPQRVFITAHEIVHNVYGDVELIHRCSVMGKVPMHDGTFLPFDNPTMQKAMDARINALLISSNIGKPANVFRGKPCGHFDPKVKSTDSVLDVYKGYYKKKKESEDRNDDGDEDNGPQPFDKLLPPGKSTGQNPSQAAQNRNQQQWQIAVSQAQVIENVRKQGRMAGALMEMFKEILEPEVSWTDYIATLINRRVGDGGYDWTQPDPWFSVLDIYQPSPTGTGAGWIVVWGDTSGSRANDEIASNMAELAGILADVNPERLTVLWCDARIQHVDEIADAMDLEHIQKRGVGGRGGTSMKPVFDWIRENDDREPDLFIGFTDGCVDFLKEPKFPVIWASSTDITYPYGQVVRVNKKGRTP